MTITTDDEKAGAAGSGRADRQVGGWGELLDRENGPAAVALAAGVGLHAVNVYLATTILPSVVDDIGGARLYAWATTIFMFASVLGSTVTSALLAARGARDSYRLAALALAVGTIVCALAPSMPVLLAGRFVQGLGGGLLFAISYSMVRVVFDERLWPRAMGLVSAMWGIATLIGPAFGGAFAELGVWRGAFWALVPLILFFGVWGARRLPAGDGTADVPRIPWAGVGLLAAAVVVISAASVSTRLLVNVAGLVVAVLLLVAWLRRERGASLRLIPAASFGPDPRLRLVYLTMALLVAATMVEVFVPYFGQRLQGLGPLAAGYLGAVLSLGWTLGSIASSGLERRRWLVVTMAPVISLVGMLALVFTGPVDAATAPALLGIGAGLLLLGWGVGSAWPHLLTRVLQLVPEQDQGLAGSSVTTIQLTATAFGSAVAGAVVNVAGFGEAAGIDGTQDAARWLFAVFAVLPLLAIVAIRRAMR